MGELRDVFVEIGGQDDNLGDSVLRAAYVSAVRSESSRLHLLVGRQATADYLSGFAIEPDDRIYRRGSDWLSAITKATRPLYCVNAGEIQFPDGVFPDSPRTTAMTAAVDAGGSVVAAGLGMRDPGAAPDVAFAGAFRGASLIAWRDRLSAEGAGFGEAAPDWAYSLGSGTSSWAPRSERPFLAVTLRFDRPWPGETWLKAVRELAKRTGAEIVTVAQVGRDAPLAVRLAEALDGRYLTPPSMRHDALNDYVRAVYRQSLAIVSDRAHGLIVAATEGAYPIGSAAAPEKLERMLAMADLGHLVGTHADLATNAERLDAHLPHLATAIDGARTKVEAISERIQAIAAAEVSLA